MTSRRVIVTQRFFDGETIDFLARHGCAVSLAELPPGKADGDLSHEELVALLDGAAGWIVGHARVDRKLLDALPALQIISRRGVGYERVDTDAVRETGKVACIAVGGNHESVADHTIALMLAVGHRFRETQADMIGGTWKILQGSDLYRKTVGIVGLGRIGTALARRLAGFECNILAMTDGEIPADAPSGITRCDLDRLVAESDYISIHAPLTAETRLLFDAERIARMKPTAFLINAARGGLVDDAALLAALRAGTIAGVGLDTFQSESDPALQPVTDALIALPNVIATPHSAASTWEGLARTNMVAAQCVVAVLDGGEPHRECVIADGRGA